MYSKGKKSWTPSPSKGVGFFQQFTRNFIRPYGRVDSTLSEEEVLKRLKTFTCEWLSRPKIALSEMSQTILENLPVMKEHKGVTIQPEIVNILESHLKSLEQPMKRVNNDDEAAGKGTQDDVKKIVRFFLDEETQEEFDETIDRCYEAGAAMYSIAVQCMVARTLLRNPNLYGKRVQANDDSSNFQTNSTMVEMKKFILNPFKPEQVANRKSRATSRKLLSTFDSDDDSDDEEVQAGARSKKRRTPLPQWSSSGEESDTVEVQRKSKREKKQKETPQEERVESDTVEIKKKGRQSKREIKQKETPKEKDTAATPTKKSKTNKTSKE